MKITKEKLETLYLTEKRCIKDIAFILKLHPGTIGRKLSEFNIPKRAPSVFRHPEATLTEKQKEVLNGALLGDGTITQNRMVYSSKSKEHVEFVWKYFFGLLTPANEKALSVVSQFDKRTNKTYTRFFFGTQSNECFTKYQKIWYKPKKIIPEDLKLTPLTCLVWYLGDGGMVKGSTASHIKISTNGFNKSQIERILLPQLSQFEAKILKTNKLDQFYVYIPRRRFQNFFNYIGDCPFSDYKHKWDYNPYKNKAWELK